MSAYHLIVSALKVEKMTNQQKQKQIQVQVELPQNIEPTYANFAIISHTLSEIIMDMAQLLPNNPKAKIHARIVMTPMNAKLLKQALEDNLKKFEKQFGEIKTPESGFGQPQRSMGFNVEK